MIALRTRFIAYAALVAFAFSLALPFAATYQLPKDHAELASVFGDKLLICTPDGFEWVKLADLAGGEVPPAHSDYECPACYVSANANFADVSLLDTKSKDFVSSSAGTNQFSKSKSFPLSK